MSAETFAAAGVRALAMTMVDNGGITRVKVVPISRLERVAANGVGMAYIWAAAGTDDLFAEVAPFDNPSGDMRLLPDLTAARVLTAAPGWAWAPVDQMTQELEPVPACQRSVLKRVVEAARSTGLDLRATFEIEATLLDAEGRPAHTGPGYSTRALSMLDGFLLDLVESLEASGIEVEQFHPEYADGQMEISVSPRDPVGAADDSVLVRQTIRAVSQRHGFQASFAPSVVAGGVGNGGHVHLSLWRDGQNLLAGGPGRYGMTADGEAFAGGVLSALPALVAVGAPSVASYLRLVPSHWAGAYQCWGRENREAALRLVTGSSGEQDVRANLEVKCFDLSANPYLVIGSLIATGLAGISEGATLPGEITGDPVSMSEAELAERGTRRLAQSLGESVSALEASDVLREAMGDPMFEAFLAVRRAEIELFADASPADVVARTRWRW